MSILVCRMDMQKWWPNCQSITVEKWQISFRTFVAMFDFMPSVLQGQRNFLECWGRPDGQHHWRQRRPSQVLHCILAGQYSLVRFGKFQMDPNGSIMLEEDGFAANLYQLPADLPAICWCLLNHWRECCPHQCQRMNLDEAMAAHKSKAHSIPNLMSLKLVLYIYIIICIYIYI